MPVPGPRTQSSVLPGYRNPDRERPTHINLWKRPAAGSVIMPGRTPALMVRTLRGMRLAAGQVRRNWRQSIDYIPATPPYSWTTSSPTPTRHVITPPALGITRALRYMTRSLYMREGVDNTRLSMLHSAIYPQAAQKYPTVGAGARRNPPTVRNRVASFGSRVQPLNSSIDGAQ